MGVGGKAEGGGAGEWGVIKRGWGKQGGAGASVRSAPLAGTLGAAARCGQTRPTHGGPATEPGREPVHPLLITPGRMGESQLLARDLAPLRACGAGILACRFAGHPGPVFLVPPRRTSCRGNGRHGCRPNRPVGSLTHRAGATHRPPHEPGHLLPPSLSVIPNGGEPLIRSANPLLQEETSAVTPDFGEIDGLLNRSISTAYECVS